MGDEVHRLSGFGFVRLISISVGGDMATFIREES